VRLFLARDVHAAKVEDDLVFLDVAADAYFCLVDGADMVRLQAGRSALVPDRLVAEQLTAAGLLSEELIKEDDRGLPDPARALDLTRGSRTLTLKEGLRALAANRDAARAVRRMDLLTLVTGAGRGSATAETGPPTEALLDEAAAFRRLAPWLPHGGVCLMRSYQLLSYLRAAGHDAAWVFGVRTWPFEAHCWLQAGDTILDDTLERVRAFRPIMVV